MEFNQYYFVQIILPYFSRDDDDDNNINNKYIRCNEVEHPEMYTTVANLSISFHWSQTIAESLETANGA